MSINEIFKQLHGGVNENVLIPVTMFDDKIEKELDIFPIKENVDVLKEKVPHLIDNIYFIGGSIVSYFCYYSDLMFVDIQSLEWKHWEMFRYTERIESIKKQNEQFIQTKDYERLFMLMEKKIVIDEYIRIFDEIPKEQKYEIFRDIWRGSEYGFEKIGIDLLEEIAIYKEYSESYNESLSLLKDEIGDQKEIKIYRGITEKSTPLEQTISWTLDIEVAKFFAKRFSEANNDKRVYEATVDVQNIMDYLHERNEKEILVLPHFVNDIKLLKKL